MTYYTDIDINLERAQDGDIKKDTDVFAIENSLKNISETMQGSRRMLPTFAFNGYSLLFENMDEETADNIGNII
jgi:phage baseplate assembly protein W